ncbi:hypothetical protein KAH81_05320, partial [bacterium]|nr:hypothetical protein [bacterium]
MILSRKANKIATQVIFLLDALLIAGSFTLAWWMRFKWDTIPLDKPFQSFETYFMPILVASVIWLSTFGWQRLFRIEFSRKWGEEISKVLKATIVAAVVSMSLTFVFKTQSYSRLMLAIGITLVFIITIAVHRIFIITLRRLLEKGIGVAKKIVVGDGELAKKCVEEILKDPLIEKGFIGILCTEESPNKLGSPSQLKEILIKNGIDEVLLAEPNVSESAIRRIIYECRKEKALFVMVPQFQALLRGRIEIGKIGEVGSIIFVDVAMTGWQRYLKRA